MLKGVPTRKEFEEMAARGRLHNEDNSFIPSDSDLDHAQSPVELGRLYGFTEDDIAHFYKFRRAGTISHTLSTCVISSKPRFRPLSRLLETRIPAD
jgi:hypothetical protein